MLEPIFFAGWSVGALSMIVFDMAWDSWGRYMKALKESKCNCQKTLHDFTEEE